MNTDKKFKNYLPQIKSFLLSKFLNLEEVFNQIEIIRNLPNHKREITILDLLVNIKKTQVLDITFFPKETKEYEENNRKYKFIYLRFKEFNPYTYIYLSCFFPNSIISFFIETIIIADDLRYRYNHVWNKTIFEYRNFFQVKHPLNYYAHKYSEAEYKKYYNHIFKEVTIIFLFENDPNIQNHLHFFTKTEEKK